MDGMDDTGSATGDTGSEPGGLAWDAAYEQDQIPWDIGRPQAVFVRLADAGEITSPVLDSGCGTGEHTMLLASRPMDVLGIDVSRTAIDRARQKAADRGVDADFQVGDVLALHHLGRTFATIIDSGVFHTFSDADRVRYVASLASVIQQGGVLHLLAFSELTPGERGPRRVTQAELRSAFADGWEVERIDAAELEVRSDWSEEAPRCWLARIVRTGSPAIGTRPAGTIAALPSRSGAGQLVAGFLAGIEHMIANRPRAVPQIEEAYRDSWATTKGHTVDGLDEPIDRPEPPDRSGARL
jgi:SAM-dependent methyltransferase